MSTQRDELFPLRFGLGTTVPLGCRLCPLFARCGGDTRNGSRYSCTDDCQGCDKAKCDKVCLARPDAFPMHLDDVGGFDLANVGVIRGERLGESLPHYIPMVHHSSGRRDPLDVPWAAIPFQSLFHGGGENYGPPDHDAGELRRRLGVARHTKLIVVGIAKDRTLERYWSLRRFGFALQRLPKLGLAAATAPNFSMFLDEPRPTHLHACKRSMICASEFTAAGIDTALYLHALADHDWRVLTDFLRARPEITAIVEEFQTGNSHPDRAADVIGRFARMESSVGRPLRLIAVGGARHISLLARSLSRWTVIDSMPFMRATKHRMAVARGTGVKWVRERDLSREEILATNTWIYGRSVARRAELSRAA